MRAALSHLLLGHFLLSLPIWGGFIDIIYRDKDVATLLLYSPMATSISGIAIRPRPEDRRNQEPALDAKDGSTKTNGTKQEVKQNCPSEPLLCSNKDCGGHTGNYKCKIANAIYKDCQCCPDTEPKCADAECGTAPTMWASLGPVTRCLSEPLVGCRCALPFGYDVADVDYACDFSDSEDEWRYNYYNKQV